jgi:hypothetical protein
MKMNMFTRLAAILLLSIVSGAAMAGQGAYALADLGISSYGGGYSAPAGIRIGGGYNFIEPIKNLTVGAEGAYGYFGSASNLNNTVKTSGLMVSGVVNYAIPNVNSLGVIGQVGIMMANTTYSVGGLSYNGSSSGVFFGVGMQYDINKQIAVRAMYEDFGSAVMMNGRSAGLTRLSAGAVLKF